MNELDIIDSLKKKEEELDNLLKETRERAARIKKDAFRKAEEIRLSMLKKLDAEMEGYKKQEIEKMDKEAAAIRQDALKKAQYLKRLAEGKEGKAVEMAVHYVIEDSK